MGGLIRGSQPRGRGTVPKDLGVFEDFLQNQWKILTFEKGLKFERTLPKCLQNGQ